MQTPTIQHLQELDERYMFQKFEILVQKAYEQGVEDGRNKYSYPHVLRKKHLLEIFQAELPTVNRVVARPDFPKLIGIRARYPRDKVFEWIDQHTAILDKYLA